MAAIKKALTDDHFSLLIQAERHEVVSAVNELFVKHFAELFESVTTPTVTLEDLQDQIEVRFPEDEALRDTLSSRIKDTQKENFSPSDMKEVLTCILKQ